MALQAAQAVLSQMTSLLSPTQPTAPAKSKSRFQPRRNATKKWDDDYIYPGQETSLVCGSTLSESQWLVGNHQLHCVPETQSILHGNDSIILSGRQTQSQCVVNETVILSDSQTQSQSVVNETQTSPQSMQNETQESPATSMTTTPKSHHGSFMRISLSQTLQNDSTSASLLPMQDLTPFQNDSQPMFSTPVATCHVQAVRTKDDVTTQTSPSPLCGKDVRMSAPYPNGDFALFRSNGNLPVLSNFYATSLNYGGLTFKSAEHAFQHRMASYHGCHDTARRILNAKNAPIAKSIAKQIDKCEPWHEIKGCVMADILLVKAQQCQKFKTALLKTGQKTLIHNIDTDDFWGCGPDLKGTNMMGVLLEELRRKLQLHETEPPVSQTNNLPTSVLSNDTNPQHANKTLASSPNKTLASAPKDNSPNQTQAENDPKDCPCAPVPEVPSVLILGNSNARSMASLLTRVNARSFFYPGGSLDYIASRVPFTRNGPDPDYIVLMAGDIEAANGLHPDTIISKYQNLIREVQRTYSLSRLIVIGLTPAGNPKRQIAIRRLNAFMQHVASNERTIAFIDNCNSRLRDSIHLCSFSKKALARKIARIVEKPHLDAIVRFR